MLYHPAKIYEFPKEAVMGWTCLRLVTPDQSVPFGAASKSGVLGFPTAGVHLLAFPMSTARAAASELVICGCFHRWEGRMRAFVGYDLSDVV